MPFIMSLISRMDSIIHFAIRPFVILASLAVACMVSWGVFSRAVLNHPVFGIEELILLSAVWLYLLGAVLAARDRSHLSADFVAVLTSNMRVIIGFRTAASIISLVMAGFFVVWSYSLLSWGIAKGQSTTVLHIPLYYSQGSLFVGSLLLVFYLVRDVLQDCSDFCRECNSN